MVGVAVRPGVAEKPPHQGFAPLALSATFENNTVVAKARPNAHMFPGRAGS